MGHGLRDRLHEVQVRLGAFLDQHYHHAPHAGLMGKTPTSVWDASERDRRADTVGEDELRRALTVRDRRRVRRDTTVSVDGCAWQLDQSFLAGRLVTVAHTLVGDDPPWVEHDGKRFDLHAVDVIKNGKTARPRPEPAPTPSVPFDPAGALLDRAAGRAPRHEEP